MPEKQKRVHNIAGEVFHRLTALSPVRDHRGVKVWKCSCSCGGATTATVGSLRSGHIRSCGCLRSEVVATKNHRHGGIRSPEYTAWIGMKQRCNCPGHEGYERYGGRGIKVDQRWQSFQMFLSDMGPRPGEGFSIERRDNNGDYTKDNCHWATRREQMRNTSRTRMIEFQGSTRCVKDWADSLGIKYMTLIRRLNQGWSVDRAFNEPVRKA